MEFPFPRPPHKNILPPAPPTRIQVFLKGIKRLFLLPAAAKTENLGLAKFAILLELILFLIQIGLPMWGVQPNFIRGIICWLLMAGLSIYIVWVLERKAGITSLGKLLSSMGVMSLIAVFVWPLAKTQYRREHPFLVPQPQPRVRKPTIEQPPVSKEQPAAKLVPVFKPPHPATIPGTVQNSAEAAIGGLGTLGWSVQLGDATTLQFTDIYKHILISQSARYFRAIDRPFNVVIVGAKSLDGLSSLHDAKYLRKLSLDAPEVVDLSELRDLRTLESLEISQTATISDLSPLQGLTNLKELHLGSAGIRDLTPIQALQNITTLSIGSLQVTDLSPIKNYHHLRVLALTGRVTDLSPLSNINTLEELSISGQQLPSLPILRHLNIKKLRLNNTRPVDLSPIGELTRLESLYIYGPQALNLTPLRQLGKLSDLSLSFFAADFTSLMQVQDIAAIGELHELRKLSLFRIMVTNLLFMRGLHRLTEFTAVDTPISDITGIEQASALNIVDFTNARVLEISPLLDLPNLRELYMVNTPARSDVLSELEHQGVKVHR